MSSQSSWFSNLLILLANEVIVKYFLLRNSEAKECRYLSLEVLWDRYLEERELNPDIALADSLTAVLN